MMRPKSVQRPAYRIPPSKYWAQYWYPRSVGAIATIQLIMTFGAVSMEIGNALVDIFRSNVFAGFWSFPFMISATVATFGCVCATRTQTKATIALILQITSIVVLLIAIGFLLAFIGTNFTLCLAAQCSQNSSTSVSPSTYLTLKGAFIICEFVCSIIFIALSIMYIILFVKCYNRLPRIHPLVHPPPRQSASITRQLSTLSGLSRPRSTATAVSNQEDTNEQQRISSSSTVTFGGAQQVCPNCQHVSPYIPQGSNIECPSCKYRSTAVEHV